MTSEKQLRRDLQGVRVGVYEIVRRLGHGATSVVYEARHTLLGRTVALKVLHEHLAGNANLVARFQREARLAASLRHPHILDVLDIARHDGLPVLVMELLDGTDLESWTRAHGPLGVIEAMRIFVPVASAIVAAHASGVVHRDLKPGNVVLARDRRGDVVPKVVDFGLSKQLDADSAVLTAETAVLGTLGYIAPEQLLGAVEVDARGDQYALAAILYATLAGRPPYEASGLVELAVQLRAGPPTPIDALVADVPPELAAAVSRALDRDPAARFPDVRAFARAVLPFADPETQRAFRRDFGLADEPSPPPPAEVSPVTPVTSLASMTAVTSSPSPSSIGVAKAEPPVSLRRPAVAAAPGKTARVKGTNVIRSVKWLRSCRARALEILPPHLHHYLDERILVSTWYPEADQLALIEACAATMPFPPGLGRMERYAFIGKAAAPLDLADYYKSVIERGDLLRTLTRATSLWRSYHDTGKMTVTFPAPGEASVTVRDYAASCPLMCSLVGGYFAGVIEYGGGIVRSTEEIRCRSRGDEVCAYRVHFE